MGSGLVRPSQDRSPREGVPRAWRRITVGWCSRLSDRRPTTARAVARAIATKSSFIQGCFAKGWVKLNRKYVCANCYDAETQRRQNGGGH